MLQRITRGFWDIQRLTDWRTWAITKDPIGRILSLFIEWPNSLGFEQKDCFQEDMNNLFAIIFELHDHLIVTMQHHEKYANYDKKQIYKKCVYVRYEIVNQYAENMKTIKQYNNNHVKVVL